MKTTIWAQITREIKRFRSGYRPERHYMRGPRHVESISQPLKAGETQQSKLPQGSHLSSGHGGRR